MPAKPTLPTIIASVALQQWIGAREDELSTLRDVKFDATDAVLSLSLDRLLALQDSQNNSDNIVEGGQCPEYDEHGGPFDVTVEEAIDEFLVKHGVASRAELTPEKWAEIQTKYRNQPDTLFVVSVTETLERVRRYKVKAKSPRLAIDKAKLRVAGVLPKGWRPLPTKGTIVP